MSQILIIDRDVSTLINVKKRLSAEGFVVLCAQNGTEAHNISKEHPLDLILIDVLTPELTGGNLLKSITEKRSIPTIVMADLEDLKKVKDIHNAKIHNFVVKPIQFEILLQEVVQLLGHNPVKSRNSETDYCKLSINDFTAGRELNFSIFLKLSDHKFIKIAHQGDEIAANRIQFYKSKGVRHLYLKKEDFRNYVGLTTSQIHTIKNDAVVNIEKKQALTSSASKIFCDKINHNGIHQDTYESAGTFVEATLELISDNPTATDVLDALRQHSDHIYAHTLGVSVYAVMMTQPIEWNMPTNKFKVAMGGLFHDIGMKELSRDMLEKPRLNWTQEEVKDYETHPTRGLSLLYDIPDLPDDVREIIKQHHENCISQGFPMKTKRTSIHPMAKLISVADEFCYRILPGAHTHLMSPSEAIEDMKNNCNELIDKKCFESLTKLFK